MSGNNNLLKAYSLVKGNISNCLKSKVELGKALRLAGFNPTKKKIDQYWSENNGSISFEEFSEISEKEKPFSVEAILGAFTRLGGTQAGLLSYDILKKALSSSGEALNEEELSVIFGEHLCTSGQVDYLRLTSAILVTLAMVTGAGQGTAPDEIDGRSGARGNNQPRRDPNSSEDFYESSNIFLIPSYYKSWNSAWTSGSIFVEEEGNYFGHQYVLTLQQDTDVWLAIRPLYGNVDLEVLLFSEQESSSRNLAASTQRKDAAGNYVLEAHLQAGQYLVVPFTSGCHFRGETLLSPIDSVRVPLRLNSGNPTPELIEALRSIFRSADLDMNGSLSYEEFNLYSAWSNGEMASNDEWDILKSNFQSSRQGDLTEEGFLQLHLAQLAQQDGEEELWATLRRMGFSGSLHRNRACSFALCVQSEMCAGHLHCLPVGPVSSTVDRTLCRVLTEQGTLTRVKNMNDLTLHHLALPHRTTYAIRNKSHSSILIRLDCSKSNNCISHRGTLDLTIQVPPKTSIIGHHLIAQDEQLPWTAYCEESFIK